MERLFPASFAYIFLAALTTMAFSCKSDNKSFLMLDLVRAEEIFMAGNAHQALELIDIIIGENTSLAEPHLLKGNIYTAVGQHEKAGVAYSKLVKIDPGFVSAWFRLGNNAYRAKQYQKAIDCYRNELIGNNAHSLQAKDKQITMLQIGRCYMHLGKIDSALISYNKCITIDSLYSEVIGDLARLHTDNGDFTKALMLAKKAVTLDENNIDYLYSLGTVYLKTNQYERAVTYLQAVSAQRPLYEGLHYNLGQAFIRSGDNIKGIKYLAKADSIQTLYSRLENLKMDVERNPNNPRTWLVLAEALEYAGMKKEADQARLAVHYTGTLKNK